MTYLIILIIIAIIVIVFFLATGLYIFKSTVTRELHDIEKSYSRYVENNLFDEALYNSASKEDITLKSFDGLNLTSTLIMNENPTNKFIVLVHGVSICYVGSLKYFDIFYKNGFNLLIVNQRRHGKSEGKYSTYGFYEKYDVNMWIEYLKSRFGNDIILGLHGESMGAGTVMETIPLNDSIKFVIEDCGYSNFHELIGFQITHAYKNRLVRKILRPSLIFANFFMKTKAKFSMKKIVPIDIVSSTSLPMMFIHGKEDYFVPWYMAVDLYKAKTKGYKELYLVEGAKHAEALEVNKILYKKKIMTFIEKALSLYK
ncbi:alpha/beta hydrolase [Clostridium perfringens]|uniref:alpha/beta hydrolase n=1 Tax=Clostridium perfringens TaxID=1502 RepID=UPI00016BC81E|nr:alpha/beta hydrolase [Clostridium perfringens]EGT0681382.1 alpha/beta hydrolase [Clostridium perfringens]MDH5069729.1 Alpha/beta hydrolase family protein [Clostridium perfringens]MDH5089500.1 Alpha/beta hydrolase family protein [Clostridium perfringens]MDM0918040.1 alpha/beta hydrolase [Clostridium perfringens]MDU2093875.1 alpha/beta hydrolase [Clostridium perfringens]